MIRTVGISAEYVEDLAEKVNKWLVGHSYAKSVDIQYRISSMELESNYNHCAFIIYEV